MPDSDLLTEERLLDGKEPVQLEEHQGQQLIDSPKQTNCLVQTHLNVKVKDSLQDHKHQTPELEDHHNKEVVCLENIGGP